MRAELTDRQKEIVSLFVSGMTYREVAKACGLSPETVNPTLKAAARKLGVGGIARNELRQALDLHGMRGDG